MAVKIQGDDDREWAEEEVRQEYAMQYSLNRANSPHILRTRGYSLRFADDPPRMGLSYLYLDWAPYGSLFDLVNEARWAEPGSEK
jgi:hypothetical protein